MNTYETIATVEDHGGVRLAETPFAPGTRVKVLIRETDAAASIDTSADVELTRLSIRDAFSRVQAQNSESVGPLLREALYDRKVLH